jgi:DNA polymerase III alpha subunit
MSYDKNEIHISGKCERFSVITTKTGTPMIKFSVRCNREQIAVVAFNELADATRLNDVEEVTVSGAIQSTSWQGKDGVQKYGYQIIASTINGVEQASKKDAPMQATPPPAPGNRLKIMDFIQRCRSTTGREKIFRILTLLVGGKHQVARLVI